MTPIRRIRKPSREGVNPEDRIKSVSPRKSWEVAVQSEAPQRFELRGEEKSVEMYFGRERRETVNA